MTSTHKVPDSAKGKSWVRDWRTEITVRRPEKNVERKPRAKNRRDFVEVKRHRNDYKLPLHMNDHVPLELCKIMLENIGLSRADVQAMTRGAK
jgi:hypothetical protein